MAKNVKNISGTTSEFSLKYQKLKAEKALAKAKELEALRVIQGATWIKGPNRSMILV